MIPDDVARAILDRFIYEPLTPYTKAAIQAAFQHAWVVHGGDPIMQIVLHVGPDPTQLTVDVVDPTMVRVHPVIPSGSAGMDTTTSPDISPLLGEVTLKLDTNHDFAGVPPSGTVITRPEFDELQNGAGKMVSGIVGGCPWSAALAYSCDGTFGPKQMVEIHGIHVTVWADAHRSSGRTIEPGEVVGETLQALLLEARDLCDHEGSTELSGDECHKRGIAHFGMCWHVYLCPKCGETYSNDSSD
jgi:hypothetical protein